PTMTRFLATALLLALLPLAGCQTDDAPAAAADTPEATPVADTAPAEDLAVASAAVSNADGPVVTVYKSPTCGCCSLWGEYLEREGFQVVNQDVANMTVVKDSLGVPGELGSCHTATVEGYVIEGHVPAEPIRQLLAEKPDARGLAVPGMPIGSPGMEQGDLRQPYDVFLLDDSGESTVYASIEGSTGTP
ncbi:MAG: DUF411 domain-containing protein, partial [Bacteroidota bacterium]